MDIKQQIQDELCKLKRSRMLVIVEGKKDIKALLNLNIQNVQELQGALFETIERIKDKEVVLLMDFDKEGKSLYSKLKRGLDRRGVRVNNNLRHLLLKSKLSHIEGLDTYLQNGNIKRNKH